MEDPRESASRSTTPAQQKQARADARSWDFIPVLFIEAIGVLLQPEGLQSARQVCRHWRQHLTTQVEACPKGRLHDLDLYPDPQQWQGRLAAVEACFPRIHSVKVFRSSTVPGHIAAEEIAMLTQLRGLKDLELDQTLNRSPYGRNPVPPVLSQLTALTRLAVRYHSHSAPDLLALQPLLNLRHLELHNGISETVDRDIGLGLLTHLETLHVSGCIVLFSRVLEVLHRLTFIKDMHLGPSCPPLHPANLPRLLLPLTRLTHLSCSLTEDISDAHLTAPRTAIQSHPHGGWLLPPERALRPLGSPGNPLLTLNFRGRFAEALPLLQALAPNLLELRLGGDLFYGQHLRGEADLLPLLQLLLPTMRLVGLSASPTLLDNTTLPQGTDIAPYIVPAQANLGTLTLLRSARHSAQPPPPSSALTRLNLIRPFFGVSTQEFRHRPLPLLASLTAHLREMHLNCSDAFLVPVVALPPLLTALFCTNAAQLLLDGGQQAVQRSTATPSSTEAASPAAQPAAAWRSSSQHAPSPPSQPAGRLPSQGAPWEGLQQLHTLQLKGYAQVSPFVGGGLPDLLRHMPNLKRLVCVAYSPQGCVADAARLRGCAQGLTHLKLDPVSGAEEDPAAVEPLCEWVGSLRHLQQLHLDALDIPKTLFLQVVSSLTKLYEVKIGNFSAF